MLVPLLLLLAPCGTLAIRKSTLSVDKYPCGQIPREALVEAGWEEIEHLRCPRGQNNDQMPGEEPSPSELDFMACALISSTKAVVWTPHVIVNANEELGNLWKWTAENTDCDLEAVKSCKNGTFAVSPLSESKALKDTFCITRFDLVLQPVEHHALADVAMELFLAAANDRGVDELTAREAEMAFGVILGYPKYSTRDYLQDPPDFDEQYAKSVDWIINKLPSKSALSASIASWPQVTNIRPEGSIWIGD